MMRTLRQLAGSKSERVRLQAALRMADILLAHQESEERREIAGERAAARRAIAEFNQPTSQVDMTGALDTPMSVEEESRTQPLPENALRDAQEFLQRVRGKHEPTE